MYCAAQREGDELRLVLQGEWRLAGLLDARAELAALPLSGVRQLSVVAGNAHLDVSAAWMLRDFLASSTAGGIAAHFEGEAPPALALVEKTLAGVMPPPDPDIPPAAQRLDPAAAVEGLGRRAVQAWHLVSNGLGFIGRTASAGVHAAASLRHWRPVSIARHVFDTGVTAIPIVALIAFLISVILAYMGAQQLRKFGADIFVVDLVTVGVLRELGVLLTAIIVAGRSGSAFAAEIGSMKLNEEVDALDATGVDAMEVLVLPRILGLLIALPLLTFIADLIGMAGGALLCQYLLDMPIQQFLTRANEAIAPTTLWAGLVKAPFFAVLIALAGTYRGLQVHGSARELGRLTTVAVVQAIFMVLLADAMFAVFFMKIDF